MGADQNIDWARTAASALDWWHDAGVDVLVEDEARDWFAAPVVVPAARTPDPAAVPQAARLPDTLEAFHTWRAGANAPDARWVGQAVPSSIVAGAPLMLLLECPESGDGDRLWSGPAGRLLDNMLAAIGRDRADTSLAALCWRRPTTSRTLRQMPPALAASARHHVALAGPKRLLTLGDAATRAMLGMSVDEARGRLHVVNHEDGTKVSVAASFHPGFLLTNPACKADAWRDLLLLTEGL